MILTQQQIRSLKKQAHPLKPVVIIGQNGLSENVLNEINLALDHHELIKVKLAGMADKAERSEVSSEIEARLQTNLIQLIGQISTFYRANPKKQKNRIII